jgi:hypothetical protein
VFVSVRRRHALLAGICTVPDGTDVLGTDVLGNELGTVLRTGAGVELVDGAGAFAAPCPLTASAHPASSKPAAASTKIVLDTITVDHTKRAATMW